jgi:hypothetical protein
MVEVYRTNSGVMGFWMMFHKKICLIAFSFLPYYSELALGNAIVYSIVAHVNGFRLVFFDGAVGDSSCGGVVRWKGGSVLGMSHFVEGNLKRAGFLGMMKGLPVPLRQLRRVLLSSHNNKREQDYCRVLNGRGLD